MIDQNQIFNIKTEDEFNALALQVFRFQFENNPVYRSFCDLLFKHPSAVETIREIPFCIACNNAHPIWVIKNAIAFRVALT